jgi:hypothetical protein
MGPWRRFGTTHDSTAGRVGARFEIDQNKIGQDIDNVKQMIGSGNAQGGQKQQGQ